ncbi:MAG: metallophosphoesterase, partial [Phycicoccus sp.]
MSRFLHVSDLHLNDQRETRHGVDADRSLDLVLAACAQIPGLDGIIVTGDIADDGSVAAYHRAYARLLRFAATHGVPLHCAVGNHDDRETFGRVFGSGHLDHLGVDRADE